MKKVTAILLAVMLMLGIAAGCSSSTESTAVSESKSSSEVDPANTTIAVCMGSFNHPVHRIVQMAFVTKGQELGYDAIISGLDEGSTQELISKFEATITNGAAGCLIWTGDDGMYEMMRDMSDQCVFVVPHFAHSYQDTKSFISRNICCLAASYGKAVADYIVDKLKAKGVTSGSLGLTQAGPNVTENAAADAFRAEIEALGTDFKVIDTVYEGLEVASAAVKVTGVIQSNSDIVGGFGTTGGSCQSWSTAMQNTNRTDLVVVGMDYTEFNQDLVVDGTISAIVAQPLYDEAQESAVSLDAIFRGADYTVSEDQWFEELPAPLAYVGGEGTSDINYYRPIVDKVIEYFSD